MKNQVFTGVPTARRFSPCPTTVLAGDPVLIGGKTPAVALDTYSSVTGGTTFLLNGSFALSVTGKSALSPAVNAAINPGAYVYADSGSTDGTTGMITGFTLDANSSSGVLFGTLDPQGAAVATGTTNASASVHLVGA